MENTRWIQTSGTQELSRFRPKIKDYDRGKLLFTEELLIYKINLFQFHQNFAFNLSNQFRFK